MKSLLDSCLDWAWPHPLQPSFWRALSGNPECIVMIVVLVAILIAILVSDI